MPEKVVVEPRWVGRTCIVAATGPSLTQEIADRCRGFPVIAVSDAYRLMPWAPVMHSADTDWWRVHDGCPGFAGEKWTLRKATNSEAVIERYGLKAIRERYSDRFSLTPTIISSGENSGYQAINLAILMGAARVVLVGFDMRIVDGRRHFFGDHPAPLRNNDYTKLLGYFRNAAANMPAGVEVINCTEGSAIQHFPFMALEDALAGKTVPPPPPPPEEPDRMKFKYIGEDPSVYIFGAMFPRDVPVEVTDGYALKKLAVHAHFAAVPDEPAPVELPAEAPEIGASLSSEPPVPARRKKR